MRWRMALGILLGALLPVPLGLLLVTVIDGRDPSHGLDEGNISPILSFEERQRLVTYERRCKQREDCEPPLGCLADQRILASYCTDSQCLTDAQCPEDFTCQTLSTLDEGPHVRRCIALGVRREGEGCRSLPKDPQEACGPGLLCSGWCGRPCRMEDPASCPAGFFCAAANPGFACQPTCEGRACPEGQQCLRFGRASSCATVRGTNCQQNPCSAGQECVVDTVPRRPGEAWAACVVPCGEARPSCPEGLLCHLGRCRQPCDPEQADTCGPDLRCRRASESSPWTCRPDW